MTGQPAYTDADVQAAAEAIGGNRPPDVPGRWALDDARTALEAVVPAIVARALREAADAIGKARFVNHDGPPLTTAQFEAAWLRARADEIEAGR